MGETLLKAEQQTAVKGQPGKQPLEQLSQDCSVPRLCTAAHGAANGTRDLRPEQPFSQADFQALGGADRPAQAGAPSHRSGGQDSASYCSVHPDTRRKWERSHPICYVNNLTGILHPLT